MSDAPPKKNKKRRGIKQFTYTTVVPYWSRDSAGLKCKKTKCQARGFSQFANCPHPCPSGILLQQWANPGIELGCHVRDCPKVANSPIPECMHALFSPFVAQAELVEKTKGMFTDAIFNRFEALKSRFR